MPGSKSLRSLLSLIVYNMLSGQLIGSVKSIVTFLSFVMTPILASGGLSSAFEAASVVSFLYFATMARIASDPSSSLSVRGTGAKTGSSGSSISKANSVFSS